ncbi:MAG: hypothetical protein FWC03_10560 [Treponema sp.]|nr:hypothetical protein [Treponema sp.]
MFYGQTGFLFLGILPNNIGGAAERIKYESGEKKLNDANFTSAFQAMADIARFLPRGYESVTYNDSQALFNTQQAVIQVIRGERSPRQAADAMETAASRLRR